MDTTADSVSAMETGDTPPRAPLLAIGDRESEIDEATLEGKVRDLADHIVATGAQRVLLVPPDQTRLHSKAGTIIAQLFDLLRSELPILDVLPATGTHFPMGAADREVMFGAQIPADRFLAHNWRDDVIEIGDLTDEDVESLFGQSLGMGLPLQVNKVLVDGSYDLAVAAGQVVPHEMAGFASFTKHLCIGLGGNVTINRSHFFSSVYGVEQTMGRVATPFRLALDRLFDSFLAPRLPVLWIMTVVEDAAAEPVLRGLFAGEGTSTESGGGAFLAAAGLALAVNVHVVQEPYGRCVVSLDPREFRSAWLANKAIYRTRMAMADGGDLVMLAPALDRFGEDDRIDALIRRHGYHGTEATLAAVQRDPALREDLGAAAHLIVSSSEGRFTITLCPGPRLSRKEVESVGFRYCPYAEARELYRPDGLGDGSAVDRDGEPFSFIRNPALGLWTTAERIGAGPSRPEKRTSM